MCVCACARVCACVNVCVCLRACVSVSEPQFCGCRGTHGNEMEVQLEVEKYEICDLLCIASLLWIAHTASKMASG
jgi:hypothetical protein